MNNKILFSDDDKLVLYIAPFLSSVSVLLFLSGSYYSSPYKVTIDGLQAKIPAIIILLFFVLKPLYDIFSGIKKSDNGKKKVEFIKKIITTSVFIYLWFIILLILIIASFIQNSFLFYMHILLIIICLYFQFQFIKEIEDHDIDI